MATHDYVIANGTGAAVRSDLNNALAAIVSNNSGSSEPGTTYAYQWWADTNANVLKLRNSSNDGWITLRELDGTMLIEDGSEGSPGLAFADDTNTGLFSPAADNIALTTGGGERVRINNTESVFNESGANHDFRVESSGSTHMLFVDAGNDRIGLNTASPGFNLHCVESGSASVICASSDVSADATASRLLLGNSVGTARFTINLKGGGSELAYLGSEGNFPFYFQTNGTERMRIDNGGRLLVGVSSSRNVGFAHTVQIEGTDGATSSMSLIRNANDTNGPHIDFAKSRGTSTGSNTVVQSGDTLGNLVFRGVDGSDANTVACQIQGQVDGTPGSNDMPGRLVFKTTADGASSASERLRISQNGNVSINTTSSSNKLRVHEGSDTPNVVIVTGADESSEFLALGVNSGVPCVTAGGVSSTDAALAFRTADNGTESEAARFDKDGRLLVGTTSALMSDAEKKLQMTHANAGAGIVLGRNDTTVTAGNTLGGIEFVGNDSNGTYQQCAKIEAKADGTHQNDDKSTRLSFSVTAGGAGSSTERMRINNAGQASIFRSGASGQLQLGTLDASTFSSNENYMIVYGSAANNYTLLRGCNTADGTPVLDVEVGGTRRIEIESDGDIFNTNGTYGTISDARLKENIVDASSQWDDVKDLQVRNFNFTEASGLPTNTQIGFVAQEVEQVSPGLVKTNPDLDQDGNDLGTTTKSVKTSVLLVKAIKALQEAMDRIETLEAKVAALEAE